MKRKALLVIMLVLLTGAAFAQKPVNPDFSGVWVLDPVQSHGNSIPTNTSTIVIRQTGDQLQFDHYRTKDWVGVEPKASDVFITDNHSRKRFATRTQVAYARAKWDKGALLIVTQTTLDPEGTQSFSDSERWTLSADGKVLTNKVSDGTVVIYRKEAPLPTPQ